MNQEIITVRKFKILIRKKKSCLHLTLKIIDFTCAGKRKSDLFFTSM